MKRHLAKPGGKFPDHSERAFVRRRINTNTGVSVRSLKAKQKPNRRNYSTSFKTNLSQQATGFRSRKHVPGDGTAHNAPHRSERWNPASSASTFTFTKATSPKGRPPTSSSSATSLSPKPEPIVSDGLIQNVEFCVYRLNNGCRSYAIPKRDLFRILAKLKFKLSKEVKAGNINEETLEDPKWYQKWLAQFEHMFEVQDIKFFIAELYSRGAKVSVEALEEIIEYMNSPHNTCTLTGGDNLGAAGATMAVNQAIDYTNPAAVVNFREDVVHAGKKGKTTVKINALDPRGEHSAAASQLFNYLLDAADSFNSMCINKLKSRVSDNFSFIAAQVLEGKRDVLTNTLALFDEVCIMCHVSCTMYHVPCIMYHVSCIISGINNHGLAR